MRAFLSGMAFAVGCMLVGALAARILFWAVLGV